MSAFPGGRQLPKVYLAGGLDNEWREILTARWAGRAEVISPFKDSRQGSIYLFTHDDLEHIRRADIVLGHCTWPQFDGIALEFGFAHALDKVIIYVAKLPRVSSMMAAVSKAVFTDLEAAAEFIEERYLRRE